MSRPQDSRDRFYAAAADIAELILAWLRSSTATNIERRLTLLSTAAVIPTTSYGDVRAIAAGLNLSDSGTRKLLKKLPIAIFKPGEVNLYRLEDVATLANIKTTGGES